MQDSRRPMESLLKGCDPEAIKWAGERTVEDFWKECPRPDWMFWAAHRAGVDPVLLILCVIDLAKMALTHATDSDPVAEATKVIDLAERWVTGSLDSMTPLREASTAFEKAVGITPDVSVPTASSSTSGLIAHVFEQVKVLDGKTLRQILVERGYDLTTLRFSVRMKDGGDQ